MIFDTVIRGGTLVTPGGPIVADLGINGEKIARQALNDGDEIMIGQTKLVMRMVPQSVT